MKRQQSVKAEFVQLIMIYIISLHKHGTAPHIFVTDI